MTTMTEVAAVEIPLSSGAVSLIDEQDEELVSQYRWRDNGAGYAVTGSRSKLMHRLIMGARPGDPAIDHVNNDPLDNRRCNLRFAGQSRNMANAGLWRSNSSGYRGVSWDTRDRLWKAYIQVARRKRHLGCFQSPEQAAHAYDREARLAWGAYARLNFPRPGERGVRE